MDALDNRSYSLIEVVEVSYELDEAEVDQCILASNDTAIYFLFSASPTELIGQFAHDAIHTLIELLSQFLIDVVFGTFEHLADIIID